MANFIDKIFKFMGIKRYKNWTDIMIDIETLGTKPNSVILSIAAVPFDPVTGGHGRPFKIHIDLITSMKAGLEIDPETLLWWMDQEKEAIDSAFAPQKEILVPSFKYSLCTFREWLSKMNAEGAFIWSKGPQFDLVILENAFKTLDIPMPWKFWNVRDVRTKIYPYKEEVGEIKFEGVQHDPLYDCYHQIKQVVKANSLQNQNP